MGNEIKNSNLPKIIFGFDKEWELENWYDSCVKKISYSVGGNTTWDLGSIPQDVKTAINNEISEEKIKFNLANILDNFLKTSEALFMIKKVSDKAKSNWGKIEKKIFPALSKMIDAPIEELEKKYYAYFTFGRRCPFCDNKFMFSQFVSFVTHASHEIMHIEFLKKYHKYCLNKGLTEKQVQHLKEILTVILNEDMKDFLSVPDRGYDSHKKIREKVLEMYKEHKKTKQNFTVFLDNSICLLKKSFSDMA
jgi:predicted metal-binding protein